MKWPAIVTSWLIVVTRAVIDNDYNSLEDDVMEISHSSETHHKPVRFRNCTRDTDIIDQLLNGTGYNKFRIPQDEGMTVYVEIWIQAITSIDELTNDFEMDIYITEKWLDPALNFERLSPCKGNLSLNHQVLDRLWTPNSCFINSKVAQIHDSPFRSVFLMLFPNGTVMVNYRVRVKGPCSLELSNFPLDLQTCGLIYESFNYNNQEVRMRWSAIDEPVQPMAPIVLPDFDLFKITANRKEEPYPAGMWDELHVIIMFERRFIWYFMQAYLPTYLTIFISFISIGAYAPLAHIQIILLTASYYVWMLVSMTFIFCSLLELAIVGYKVRDESKAPSKVTSKKSKPLVDGSPRGTSLYEKRFMFPPGCNASRSITKTNIFYVLCWYGISENEQGGASTDHVS
ncbi:Neurotransmitter-gated ion-channel ligand binding domain protein [Teladorsagia circumcincta]|uniref:Neurotransmitter-gated ion-channel ligand binding domain protein n=1 Tax=Teladorsagia circumcincta TaxID=45464 RepID=A0A2G9U7W0_TELCI|nr:Neurotransmitter-gated ion-channel ligand binding domain protein [Teladorsagia circumcincta]